MNAAIDLKGLRYFVALAEELHFAKAAQRLNTTQSVVSRQLQQLEARMGGPLLTRSTRFVGLTKAGAHLLEDARQLLIHAERVEARARAATAGLAGHIRIGVTPASGLALAPAAIRSLRAERPEVSIELVEDASVDLEIALHAHALDCAFLHPSGGHRELTKTPVFLDPMDALLSEEHPLAQKNALELADLAGRDVLFYERRRAAGLHDRFLALLRTAGSQPRKILPCTTFGHTIAGVGAALGIGFLPRCMTTATRVPGTLVKPFAQSQLTLETVFAVSAPRVDDPLIEGLWRTVIEKTARLGVAAP